MRIYLEEEGDYSIPLECRALAEAVAEAVLDAENCPYEAQAELLLTTDKDIRELNRQFRQIDRATDVLSFPMTEYEVPGEFGFLEERPDCFDPETGELMLGNIVISKERTVRQAEEYGHSVKREFAFLITHSMLHLLGYDHIEEEDRRIMEEKQKTILDNMDITR